MIKIQFGTNVTYFKFSIPKMLALTNFLDST